MIISILIQIITGTGCPSLDRKVVNSGKRLRAHVGIDEGNVCTQNLISLPMSFRDTNHYAAWQMPLLFLSNVGSFSRFAAPAY